MFGELRKKSLQWDEVLRADVRGRAPGPIGPDRNQAGAVNVSLPCDEAWLLLGSG